MDVCVRVPSALREVVAGEHAVVVPVTDPVTVGRVLDALRTSHPALERRVRDELGEVRRHVNLFVGDDHIRDLDGLATAVPPGRDLSIIAAVSGG